MAESKSEQFARQINVHSENAPNYASTDQQVSGRFRMPEPAERSRLSPDTGDTFLMRMWVELIKDATTAPKQAVAAINRRPLPRRIEQEGRLILLLWTL
jgi:hypothetical protein